MVSTASVTRLQCEQVTLKGRCQAVARYGPDRPRVCKRHKRKYDSLFVDVPPDQEIYERMRDRWEGK